MIIKGLKGFQSYCLVKEKKMVFKRFEEYAIALGLLENEVQWYSRFNSSPGYPAHTAKMLDYNENTITLQYVGEPITKQTIPCNFKDQLSQIAYFLQLHQCQHCDITPNNLLFFKGRIFLIDFGWAVAMGQDPYQKWSQVDRIVLDCMNHPYRAPDWPNNQFSLALINKEFSLNRNDNLDLF